MSTPAELSFDEILKYMLAHNGKVTNYELVKHFKVFLMNPNMRDEARNTFKKHVNSLAVIKTQNNEKWLILKKKYLPSNQSIDGINEIKNDESMSVATDEPDEQPPSRPPLPLLNQDFNLLGSILPSQDPVLPPPIEHSSEASKEIVQDNLIEDIPPKVHPRRKSEKATAEKTTSASDLSLRMSIPNETTDPESSTLTSSRSESTLIDSEQKISVKERKQMFNRMASESDVLKSNKSGNSTSTIDYEGRASPDHKETEPLDPKQKQWILCAARGDYHVLAKMCKENSKLVKTKDPFTLDSTRALGYICRKRHRTIASFARNTSSVENRTGRRILQINKLSPVQYFTDVESGNARPYIPTESAVSTPTSCINADCYETLDKTAMHWACKRGDENLVKLLAGIQRHIVNERSGYTPLHIAMQFRRENVYRLLVEVYDADPNVRDWSGKKPRQYLVHMDTSLSPGSYRKKEGFLRIGSLNVRVKKTTEAFSNFLGVGATRSSAYVPKSARERELDRRSDDSDQLKSWGSADNIQKDDKMLPPMNNKVRKRAANGRRGVASHSRSTPSTPDQPRAQIGAGGNGDSDSDSAAGFHAAWRQLQS
ncbi:unnamed protein product [Leptosia nina]|uniref:SOWAHA-C winged helix-turn-helix domain-containing protein n=1 Tax=Leptosia nina TaxID=320188 RepID=A0AAV1JZ89_9NEOP